MSYQSLLLNMLSSTTVFLMVQLQCHNDSVYLKWLKTLGLTLKQICHLVRFSADQNGFNTVNQILWNRQLTFSWALESFESSTECVSLPAFWSFPLVSSLRNDDLRHRSMFISSLDYGGTGKNSLFAPAEELKRGGVTSGKPQQTCTHTTHNTHTHNTHTTRTHNTQHTTHTHSLSLFQHVRARQCSLLHKFVHQNKNIPSCHHRMVSEGWNAVSVHRPASIIISPTTQITHMGGTQASSGVELPGLGLVLARSGPASALGVMIKTSSLPRNSLSWDTLHKSTEEHRCLACNT